MTEYDPLTMLSVDELKDLRDLSGLTLYKAETKNIPPLTSKEEQALLDEARQGSVEARNRLLLNCIAFSIRIAEFKMRERRMRHSDITDLLGEANIHMLEKFPKALEQDDPLYYLMGEVMYTMKHYMIYKDPMIQRSRQVKLDPHHPITETGEAANYEKLLAPDLRLVAEEKAQYPELHTAIAQLIPNRRNAIVRRFGLYGHPEESVREIAKSEGRTPRSIDSAVFNGRRSLAKTLSGNS